MGAGQSPNRKVKSTLGQLSWLNSAACTDTIGYCIQFNAHGFSVSRIFHLSNKQTNNRYLSQPDTCSNAWEYLEQEDNCGFSKCGNIALRARILQRPVFLIIRCIVGQVLACNNAHTICYCFTPHNLTLLSLQWMYKRASYISTTTTFWSFNTAEKCIWVGSGDSLDVRAHRNKC